MSQDQNLFQMPSFTAAADLDTDTTAITSQRYRAVKATAARKANVVAADTDVILGVQQNLPKSGELVEIVALGTAKARAGGVIAVNAYVKLEANGNFISGGGGADRNWGIALDAAAADGDIIEIYLTGLVVT